MSAVTSVNYANPTPAEPFGQAGVRQYAGRLLAWAFLTAGLCAAAMAHRSTSFGDSVEWRGEGQIFRAVSSGAQLSVVVATGTNTKSQGWGYVGRYGPRRTNMVPWQSSTAETLGFETRSELPFINTGSGVWVRFKWPTIAAAMLVFPLVYFISRIVRRAAV